MLSNENGVVGSCCAVALKVAVRIGYLASCQQANRLADFHRV